MKRSQLADMLTKIRNGQKRNKKEICIGIQSKICQQVLDCFVQDGWINYWYFKPGSNGNEVYVCLKYYAKKSAFQKLSLISKPSRKIYISVNELSLHLNSRPKITSLFKNQLLNEYHPFETWVLSTSNGILTCKNAYKKQIGGLLLCSVY